ncbi:DUF1156 domain-containing protein [Pyrococcus abyssi]|uniref:Adenine-specific DNA methylase n=1 Tax=Pyrococcus abyssi (strain GE5 / Orsay) TaxID=272844 RepID=Q9V0B3_PYRAB|nr:DUF1156 domain-containing protein [Pyrococcus abyssi]CAB49791.1 Predicted DNA methylase [Pyrococcus abyssi GE5]CCE70283.1 TPA: Adenine-specific DNA methylase [Pyrococcus abyssi GE5]
MGYKRLIESLNFPVVEVNKKSEKEKGPARPPYWEMVFWWTRKPLVGARAIIAASLLPEDVDVSRFKSMIGLNESTPHRVNPRIPQDLEKYFRGKKLLDPFAGFGSIPLEGLRLGLDVTAVELLPVAYVFLKAVLEYPKKFGKTLVRDVERWGNWITEQLKNDPEIRELYDDDVAVYIGTWEIKCPHCGRFTLAVGNYWLARVKDSKGYKRLAYMVPEGEGVRIIDLNEILGDVSRAKVKGEEIVFEGKGFVEKVRKAVEEGKIKEGDVEIKGDKVIFRVPSPNIEARKSQLTCLACGNVIRYADENGRHYTQKPEGVKVDFYVKFALKKYHEGDERFARQRLLVKVKVKDGDLIFEPATKEDNEKLLRAKEKVRELIERKDPDVPTEQIPLYENRRITPILSAERWFHLFNPRQLLTLIKIVRLIREVGKKVEEEKLKEGWDEERAFEYAEAVATYLSMVLMKYAIYNSYVTYWNSSLIMAPSLAVRGIAMQWNPYEISPSARWTGSWRQGIEHTFSRSLEYLTTALAPSGQKTLTDFTKTNTVKVLQGDATSLNLGEKFDVIVTDPPYADDVPYTELSDFYYVWLKRALSDSDGKRLIPRFHKTAFFKKVGAKWVEIKTQWQEFAKREVSTNPGRFMDDENRKEKAVQHFENLFAQAFVAMREHLKDDGLLVTYYAHTDPESWLNLLNAGWRRAGLQITRAIPLTTESSTSIVKRGKLSLDTSIVVVWRKSKKIDRVEISRLNEEISEKAIESAKLYMKHGYRGLDLLYGVMASILEEVTKYSEVTSPKGALSTREILERHVYPATIRGIVEALADVKGRITSNEGLFYSAYKVLFGNASISPNDIVLLNLATFTNAKLLIRDKILKQVGSGKKEFRLYSPDILGERALNTRELQAFLRERGLNPQDPVPRNSVDVLHLLEYYSLLGSDVLKERVEALKKRHAPLVEEAIAMAKLVSSYYKAMYSQMLSPLGVVIRADERKVEGELMKDGHYEVVLMSRLVRNLGGGVI